MTQNKTLTDNEAFEKWAMNYYGETVMSLHPPEHYLRPNEYRLDTYRNAWEGWQAAQQESAKKIAELKEQVHNLNWALGTDGYEQMATVEQQLEYKEGLKKIEARIANMKHRKDKITELQSQVNQLRDAFQNSLVALEKANNDGLITDTIWVGDAETLFDYMGEALSATAKQSLIEHDNATIERCAKVANGFHDCDAVAESIRALIKQ